MSEPIQVQDLYEIHAASTPWMDRTRVLKDRDTFAVLNASGDILQFGGGQQGLFHEGTRYLSGLALTIDGVPPLVLSSAVREDNFLLSVDMTTPDIGSNGSTIVPQDRLHILREQFLWDQGCHIRLRFSNYHTEAVRFTVEIRFDADYCDIFEVRGMTRTRRGTLLAPETAPDCLRLGYLGLDDVTRRTEIRSIPAPDRTTRHGFISEVALEPEAVQDLEVRIEIDPVVQPSASSFGSALSSAEQYQQATAREWATVETSNTQFNEWLMRSAADVRVLTTQTTHGLFPYAGVPWFSTPFGRDGIIAALEAIWMNPDLAGGVLRYLAATQATEVDPGNDAQPGKILHETRGGEMAALNEHPFRRYYGSVDSTPLFVVLAGEYFRATADHDLLQTLWPNIEAAIGWIDQYGDSNGDGFVDYARSRPDGLVNQGWKDSQDSVFHADGTHAQAPVALSEVQGYVYGARLAAAALADALELTDFAARQRQLAARLHQRFDEAFWDAESETYALAIDGTGLPCRVVASNPGHCLLTGLVPHARAALLTRRLMADDMYSGWGIRTLAESQNRFNPMSYHNGSIWPHDNAMIAGGFARYGYKDETLTLLTGFFDAAMYLDMQRMPELFCGFGRRAHHGPTLYPVACLPQAWSAASVFMLLGACLGLEVDATDKVIRISSPALPPYLDVVTINRLRVGDGEIDLQFHRYPDDIGVNVLRRTDDITVEIIK